MVILKLGAESSAGFPEKSAIAPRIQERSSAEDGFASCTAAHLGKGTGNKRARTEVDPHAIDQTSLLHRNFSNPSVGILLQGSVNTGSLFQRIS